MGKKLENSYFKNKKALIMGLGLHGGGLSVAKWMIKQGAVVRITDLKVQKQLQPSIKIINKSKFGCKVQYSLGGHQKKDFLWADIVVQNPAVPKESEFLKIAARNGAVIENEATLFFKLVGAQKIIGVTGTRGKSTTASLIHQILKAKNPQTIIAGNIKTVPMFEVVETAKNSAAPIVLELSSWHLENLGERKLSPKTAVLTNLMPDHLNRYQNATSYYQAKTNIFLHQNKNDYSVFNYDNQQSRKFAAGAISKKYWFSKKYFSKLPGAFMRGNIIYFNAPLDRASRKNQTKTVMPISGIVLPGEHNLENVLAAVAVAKIYNIPNKIIQEAINNFSGLKYRLEPVAEIDNIKFINDTTATTPQATIAGLMALGGKKEKNIILIAGGSDKKIPQSHFDLLGKNVMKYCRAVILFKGRGSKKILDSINAKNLLIYQKIKSMAEAVKIAKSCAVSGNIIMLSPACASFGLFANEFDRGDQFEKLIKKYG